MTPATAVQQGREGHAGEVDERFRLRAGATAELAGGRLVLGFGSRRFAIRPVALAMATVVEALRGSASTAAELTDLVHDDDEDARRQLRPLLARLVERGWLERTLWFAGRPLATCRPIGSFRVDPALGTKAAVVLSRFALLRRQGGDAVIESPRSPALVVLHEPSLAALVAWLARPRRPGDVAAGVVGVPPVVAGRVLEMLSGAGLLVAVGEGATTDERSEGAGEEEASQHLAQWNVADLLFHSRSRAGRHANSFGGTWPLKGRFDPLPAVPAFTGEPVALPRPDLAAVAAQDPSFTAVLERRRSVREHDDGAPVTLGQLGEFLYRAARVRTPGDPFHDGARRERGADRPYPSGGALYELELYPVVRRCDGLRPGLYRYDPFEHRLGRLAEWGPEVELLVEDGRVRSLMTGSPQVLIGVTARFGRVMYKYESMAYATILKNVGVLYQTMYCVATAMGLAPCALGGGDAGRLADVAGLDYHAQSAVGEFLLGSRADGG